MPIATAQQSPDGRPPEALLASLNQVLLRLRAAADDLHDDTIPGHVLEVLRKTQIPEYLHKHLLVAVAGAQGAGKTTFIRECYGLDDTWLGSNAGRGERVPVMVVEDEDARSARGWALEMGGSGIEEVKLDPVGFGAALGGLSGRQVMLGLTVPAAVFRTTGRGFLLLPGYEPLDPSNEEWQAVMRAAMIAAPDVIVVVDRALLAGDAQQPILEDLRDTYLAGARPLVVVSKTERLTAADPERAQLRTRAAALFSLRDSDQVVLTGRGDPGYREAWLGELTDVLARVLPSTRTMRQRQLDHLRHVVRRDVRDLRDRVRDAVQTQPDDPGSVSYRLTLAHFDDAARQAAAEYARAVRLGLDRHRQETYVLVDEVITRRVQTDERIEQLKMIAKGQGYLHRRAQEREFAACWDRAGVDGNGFAAGHLRATAQAIEALNPLLRDLGPPGFICSVDRSGRDSTAIGSRDRPPPVVDLGGLPATLRMRPRRSRPSHIEREVVMSNYVLAFRGRPDRTPQQGEEQAWGAWFGSLGSAVTDFGNRVGATRTLRARRDLGPDGRVLTGYIVVTAEDLDAAAQLAAGCPGLAHDVDVEVAEVVGA